MTPETTPSRPTEPPTGAGGTGTTPVSFEDAREAEERTDQSWAEFHNGVVAGYEADMARLGAERDTARIEAGMERLRTGAQRKRAEAAEAERDRARDLTASLEAECARLSDEYRQRLADVRDEYRKAGESWDRQRERLQAALAKERAKVAAPCPTCSPPVRETTGLVCLTCGWDYGAWGEKPRAALTGPTETGAEPAEQRTYATDHGFTPPTGPFGGGDGCRVMLARYACPYSQDEHDPSLPPVDIDVFGYRRHPKATETGDEPA